MKSIDLDQSQTNLNEDQLLPKTGFQIGNDLTLVEALELGTKSNARAVNKTATVIHQPKPVVGLENDQNVELFIDTLLT